MRRTKSLVSDVQEMEEGELVQILKRSKTVLDLKLTHLHRYDGKLLLGYKSERETDLLESDQTSEA